MNEVIIIGGGLAGSEAAWQLAERGVKVCLYEMRTAERKTHAHVTDHFAELVCSNSFRADDPTSAIGLLHEEMRRLGSLIIATADKHKVPAGGALAVDREGFSEAITHALSNHPKIRIIREEIIDLTPLLDRYVILASGPLTSSPLAASLASLTGSEYLAFFDAIAPIVTTESIDFSKAWYQSRYDKAGPGGNGKDYINCPLSKEEYERFIDALLASDTIPFKDWEKDTPYFEGCLPIEVMAARGRETLSFGPMKPVGLTNPHHTERPYAVVQLRQDNALGTLYNMVGFQTKLRYGHQTEIFRMIPGLEHAEFVRLGGIHRNTFIHSPSLLNPTLGLCTHPKLKIAGQISGVEGYVESASMGLLAGMFTAAEFRGATPPIPPRDTALGSLLAHITTEATRESFQPMNINFGLFPPLDGKKIKKKDRKAAYAARARESLTSFMNVITLQYGENMVIV